jgi:hypothetical protein
MTIVAGLIQSLLAPSLRRLRPLLPPEIGGLVVFFVGTSVAAIGCRYIMGVGAVGPVDRDYWLVGALTLAVTVGLNVWGRGPLRVYCIMIGMAVGYAAALATGVLPMDDYLVLSHLAFFALPRFDFGGWAFSPAMLVPFTVAALAITLKGIGHHRLPADQRRLLVRAEMGRQGAVARQRARQCRPAGRLAWVTPSTANIGLQAATGVSSRPSASPSAFDRAASPAHRLADPDAASGDGGLLSAACFVRSAACRRSPRMLDAAHHDRPCDRCRDRAEIVRAMPPTFLPPSSRSKPSTSAPWRRSSSTGCSGQRQR